MYNRQVPRGGRTFHLGWPSKPESILNPDRYVPFGTINNHLPQANAVPVPDRKRRRTSELLSRSPTDKHILLAIRRVLDRTASLDVRVKQLEKLITECLNADNTCRYDSEQEEQIYGHINATVDERIDEHMWDVQRELEGELSRQTEEWVAETVDLAQEELREELRHEIEDRWDNDITVKMKKMVKVEVLKDMAQAVKVMKRARAYREDVKSTTRRRMSTTTASTQSTAASTKPILTKPIPTKPIPTKPIPSTTLNHSLPGASAFQAAIQDIQRRYSAKMSAEEIMRVMDHLEANLVEAVKYNGCGAELKWLYVQRWAAKQEE